MNSVGIQVMLDAKYSRIGKDATINAIPLVSQFVEAPQGGGYLQQGIDEALAALKVTQAGKSGLSIYLTSVFMHCDKPNIQGVYFDTARFYLFVFEEPIRNARATGFAPNGAGIRAGALAEYLARSFAKWSTLVGSEPWFTEYCNPNDTSQMPQRLKDIVGDAELISHVIAVRGSFGLAPLDETPLPRITLDGANVILGPVEDANIYYTLDGSTPVAGNATATLYADPFATPAAGTLVRAAAYADGLLPSVINGKIVP